MLDHGRNFVAKFAKGPSRCEAGAREQVLGGGCTLGVPCWVRVLHGDPLLFEPTGLGSGAALAVRVDSPQFGSWTGSDYPDS